LEDRWRFLGRRLLDRAGGYVHRNCEPAGKSYIMPWRPGAVLATSPKPLPSPNSYRFKSGFILSAACETRVHAPLRQFLCDAAKTAGIFRLPHVSPIPNCLRQLANLSKIRIVSQRAVGTEQANGTVNWEPVTSGFHHHAEFLDRSGKRGRQVIPNAASRLCILLSRQSLTRTYINVSIRLVGSLEVYTVFSK
jgi:hypothetical protein